MDKKLYTDEEWRLQNTANYLKDEIAKIPWSEQQRMKVAADEAKTYRGGKTAPGLGKHVAEIPMDEFLRLVNKYGHEHVHSKEFMKYFQKRFKDLSTASV